MSAATGVCVTASEARGVEPVVDENADPRAEACERTLAAMTFSPSRPGMGRARQQGHVDGGHLLVRVPRQDATDLLGR
jgi:hypothetical protein